MVAGIHGRFSGVKAGISRPRRLSEHEAAFICFGITVSKQAARAVRAVARAAARMRAMA
jgi:hypothetical protein